MKCSDWRLGISPVIWRSVRSPREQPRGGADCVSRKCVLPGGVVRRYTICRAKDYRIRPRVRIYDNDRMIGSWTVGSFEEGRRQVDKMISGAGFGSLQRWLDPSRMRCGTFALTHGREGMNAIISGNMHMDDRCDYAQAGVLLEIARKHRAWMLEKARECVRTGKKVDLREVRRLNRKLRTGAKALEQRLRLPCTPKYPPPVPLDFKRSKEETRRLLDEIAARTRQRQS